MTRTLNKGLKSKSTTLTVTSKRSDFIPNKSAYQKNVHSCCWLTHLLSAGDKTRTNMAVQRRVFPPDLQEPCESDEFKLEGVLKSARWQTDEQWLGFSKGVSAEPPRDDISLKSLPEALLAFQETHVWKVVLYILLCWYGAPTVKKKFDSLSWFHEKVLSIQ